jgi:hypothetical protein
MNGTTTAVLAGRRPGPGAWAGIGARGIAMAVLVAGCSDPGHGPQAPSGSRVVVPSGASASADPGTGSGERPFQAGCSGSIRTRAPAQPTDFAVGPLRYGAAASWATMPPPADVELPDGRYFYKTGAILRPGAVVTVTVAPEARRNATIAVQGGPDPGSASVTYRSCPAAPDTVWPGGFLLTEQTACLPLDVSVLGEPGRRHVMLSVFHRSCPTPHRPKERATPAG